MVRDLQDRSDVTALLEGFYRGAFADPLIGPIFTEVSRMDLDSHLPVICDFWETVLFNSGRYQGNMLQVHVALNQRFPLQEQHFARWLELWVANVDERFVGEKADLAKTQGRQIADSLRRRMAGRSGSGLETVARRKDSTSGDRGAR
jgi:hemoglobin